MKQGLTTKTKIAQKRKNNATTKGGERTAEFRKESKTKSHHIKKKATLEAAKRSKDPAENASGAKEDTPEKRGKMQ